MHKSRYSRDPTLYWHLVISPVVIFLVTHPPPPASLLIHSVPPPPLLTMVSILMGFDCTVVEFNMNFSLFWTSEVFIFSKCSCLRLSWLCYLCHNRYRNGIHGHMKAVVLSLLRRYLQHEVLFNEGTYLLTVQTLLLSLLKP